MLEEEEEFSTQSYPNSRQVPYFLRQKAYLMTDLLGVRPLSTSPGSISRNGNGSMLNTDCVNPLLLYYLSQLATLPTETLLS